MALLAAIVLGAAWWAVTAVSTPIDRTAIDRGHNARILQEAKSALIGYVAHHTAMAAENDPGKLPCPEAAANIGTANEGITAPSCTLPAVGRLPWRTLGLDKWRDSSGEPLWYVVSPGWTKPNPVTNTVINSNSAGQLTLDGTGDVVALIIAPGGPLAVQASPGCTARVQRRTTPSPAIDLRDYLECQNADVAPIDAAFASNGPAGSFNDQVLSISGAEILPTIEAAVAHRFERDVAPLLASVYSGGSWPANPLLAFAAPFAANPAASDFKGVNATSQGLLPFAYSTDPATGNPCNPADARCDSTFVAWQASPPGPAPTMTGVVPGSDTCTATATQITCSFRASYLAINPPQATFTITHTANNVGMVLRQFDTTVPMAGVEPAGRTASGVMNVNGSAALSISGTTTPAPPGNLIGALLEALLCGLGGVLGLTWDCATYTVTVPITVMADHVLVRDSAAQNPQHWFLRNGWHQLSYYAVAPAVSPAGPAPRNCVSGASCLTLSFENPLPSNNHRGLIVIAGRGLAGQNRPPLALTDWLEGANCDLAGPSCAPDTTFAVRSPPLIVNRSFNDRIAVISSN